MKKKLLKTFVIIVLFAIIGISIVSCGDPCNNCLGSGYISDNGRQVRCGVCNGSGRIKKGMPNPEPSFRW